MTSPSLRQALSAARDCVPGCSDKDAVWQSGKLTLYRYRRIAGAVQRKAKKPPLLIVYALVNRPYMMDLQQDRSLIRGLLAEGQDVYLIDWGYPDGADRLMSLTDYVDELIVGCVQHILQAHGIKSLNMLGVCQGGVLSLCFTTLYPRQVRNLITMVTPVDFHTPDDLMSKWVQKIDVVALVAGGNVPGSVLNQLFVSLMPFRLAQQKYVDLFLGTSEQPQIDTFMRVEHWIFDSPDQAGAAFQEFVVGLYQENRLIRGEFEIAGRKIDLRTLKLPMLNLFGSKDHLVPRAASLVLKGLVGSKDYTALEFDLGHIGMYISARAQREVPASIARWLATR